MNFKILLPVSLLLSFLLVVSSVSAADAASSVSGFMQSTANVVNAVVGGLQPLFDFLLGKPNDVSVTPGTNSFLIVKILLLVIVFALVYTVLDSFPLFNSYGWVLNVVSVAVSILSVRFLSDGWINAILFPYQAFGIALTVVIPFIIYFVFVEVKLKDPHGTPFLRRFLWIFFGVVFLFMYISRQFLTESPSPPLFIWIYLVAALVAFVMAWVDGTIQKWMVKGTVERSHAHSKTQLIRALQREIQQADRDLRSGVLTPRAYTAEVARINAAIAAIT